MRVHKVGNNANNPITVSLNLSKLESIQRQLGRRIVAEVGIMGDKNARQETTTNKKGKHVTGKLPSSKTNAEIGLVHEKGSFSSNIPRRSFLEMPLKQKLPQVMRTVGNKLLEGISATNILVAYQKLGIIAEGIVLGAFNSSGYGQWEPNRPSTIARKGSSRPLIDTAQLRKSISSRVATK